MVNKQWEDTATCHLRRRAAPRSSFPRRGSRRGLCCSIPSPSPAACGYPDSRTGSVLQPALHHPEGPSRWELAREQQGLLCSSWRCPGSQCFQVLRQQHQWEQSCPAVGRGSGATWGCRSFTPTVWPSADFVRCLLRWGQKPVLGKEGLAAYTGLPKRSLRKDPSVSSFLWNVQTDCELTVAIALQQYRTVRLFI